MAQHSNGGEDVSGNKKARPVGSATEQAQMGVDCGSHIPKIDCIITNPPCRAGVVDLLSHGAANAICMADLVKLAGRDNRTIRAEIHKERRRGVPIVSENSDGVRGYYIAETSDELRRFARSMTHRAGEILAVARAAEKTLDDFEGQASLDGWHDGR